MSRDTQSVCPHCNSTDIAHTHRNQKICQECNFIIDSSDRLDNSSLHNDQYKSTKENPSKEADWDEVATPRDSSEQILVDMIGKTETCIQELDGTESDCVRGAEILTDIWRRGYFQGRSTNVGIAATVYVTFRSQNPRPLSIVATVCDISTEKLRSGYRSLRSEYGISGNIVNPAAYLSFLSSKLSLSQPVLEQAKSLIESSSSVAGNPTGIAAAALYLAAQSTDETITLAEAGKAAGVTKETVWHKTQEFDPIENSRE